MSGNNVHPGSPKKGSSYARQFRYLNPRCSSAFFGAAESQGDSVKIKFLAEADGQQVNIHNLPLLTLQ